MTKELDQAGEILGISKSATEEEVKKKYRALAKKWHPDVNPTQEAHKKMQEINKAYELIMKEKFGKIDVWEDYQKWWYKQFANDPIWGNYVPEEGSAIEHKEE